MSFKRPLGTSGEEKHDKRPRNVNLLRNLGLPSDLGRQMPREHMRAVVSNWNYFELPVASGDSFLFETEVNCSNRLLIPTERAKQHFPRFNTSATNGSNELNILHLAIPQTKDWHMPIIHYEDEDAFMFTRLWPQFVKFHNLKVLDKIRFYKPYPCLHTRHYVVEFERSERNVTTQIPEFRQKNFLFKIEMTAGDVGYKRLFIHNDDVIGHFPLFHIPKEAPTADIIKFTDAHNKDWYMDVMRYNSDFYVIIEGWDGFVKERNLKAKDVIKFYVPVQPSHLNHFLIECVKNKGKSNPTRPGSRKNEGDGKQGDRGEPSRRGRKSTLIGETEAWKWKWLS